MKYLHFLLVALLLMACNTAEDKKQTTDKAKNATPAKTSKKTAKSDADTVKLDQNGDYTSLFSRENCEGIITAEEISAVLGFSVSRQEYDGCHYEIIIPGEEPNLVTISSGKMNRSDIEREIKSFKKNAPILQYVISDTGDTYLCIQATHGRILLYNPNYDGYVMVGYMAAAERIKVSKEQIEKRKKTGIQIANAILKKHQRN